MLSINTVSAIIFINAISQMANSQGIFLSGDFPNAQFPKSVLAAALVPHRPWQDFLGTKKITKSRRK